MLNQQVADAVEKGKFHIYSIKTIDEGIEILTGVPAGKRDENGCYPENTVHYLVNEKLKFFTQDNKTEEKDNK